MPLPSSPDVSPRKDVLAGSRWDVPAGPSTISDGGQMMRKKRSTTGEPSKGQDGAAGRKPLRGATEAIYADFGLTAAEVFECTFCGLSGEEAIDRAGRSLIAQVVPVSAYC